MMDDSSPGSLWIICHSYPPIIGGSEIEVQRIAAALQKRGHRVRVLCAGGSPMPAQAEWVDPLGIPVRIIAGGWPFALRNYGYALGVAWELLVRGRSCQTVYFLMTGIHLATGLPLSRWLGKRILMKFSGSNTIRPLQRSGMGRMELGFLRRWAEKIMILNPAMQQEALEAGLPSDKLMWMPNPIDISHFRPATEAERSSLRSHLKLEERDVVLLFVGRLAPEKELPSLLGAFSCIAEEFPHAKLVLVGDGPMRPALEQQAAAAGLSGRIRFTGMVHPDQVCSWLQASDVFTLVSSLEGLPCSLIEAMATELPSLVSDIPAITQVVDHQKEAWVAPLKKEAALAEGLRQLLGDENLRKRLAKSARARAAQQFSTDVVVTYYEALL